MRIGTNMSARISSMYLNRAEKSLADSLEKLSSGYKINSSKDDSAGMAISEKMRTQINNLNRASQNSSDGISVAQASEGALNEIQAMLQRMNELAVQGANDSYTDEDRSNIQHEIEALREEIDRISSETEFNNTKLLNGEVQRRTYSLVDNGAGGQTMTSAVKTSYLTNSVEAGEYGLIINADGTADFSTEGGSRKGFSDTAVMTSENGKIRVTDADGFEMEFTVDMDEGFTGEVTVQLMDLGTMPIQVGANADQIMNITIPEVSSMSLNLDTLDLTTTEGCEKAITTIREATSRVSRIRSEIGACQNRLEYSVSSIESTEENMTMALSRITDVDMAEEIDRKSVV